MKKPGRDVVLNLPKTPQQPSPLSFSLEEYVAQEIRHASGYQPSWNDASPAIRNALIDQARAAIRAVKLYGNLDGTPPTDGGEK